MKKIKTVWLISFALFFLMGIVDDLFKTSDSSSTSLLIDAIISLAWGSMTFHFAYRKSGRKWLLLVLILTPFRTFEIVANFYDKFSNYEGSLLFSSLVLSIQVVSCFFWINCFLLRKANKATVEI